MGKLLFILVIYALYATFLEAACPDKVDAKKVMLFIDVNNSVQEIDSAAKAACARGETLAVIPKNYKDYEPYLAKFEQADKINTNCRTKSTNKCENESAQRELAYSNLEAFKAAQPLFTDAIKKELEEIKISKGSLENLIISGHDGGGSFSGLKTRFSRPEMQDLLKDYQDINNVKSVMLLGCYTGVRKEVQEWQSIFPDVRLIAGYDGTGPLSDRLSGHQYIEDILIKEKEIVRLSDQKKINDFMMGQIRSLKDLNAAFFIKPVCQATLEEKSYYYGSQDRDKTVKLVDEKACIQAMLELPALLEKIEKYDSGELEIPKDTSNGELRQILTRVHANEQCDAFKDKISSNKVFNLLFYESVKKNYANFYKDDLNKEENILKGLTSESLLLNAKSETAKDEQLVADVESSISFSQTNPIEFETTLKANYEKLQADLDKARAEPVVRRIRTLIETGGVMTSAEAEKYVKYLEIENRATIAKTELEKFKSTPVQYITEKKTEIEGVKKNINNLKLALEPYKTKEVMSTIWIPNQENLNKHNRKEFLSNLHNIAGILSLQGLSEKEREALTQIMQSAENRLQYFQNPFSWHEYTGHTEKPPY